MGQEFGQLDTIRGIVYFRLSPHEQKPFVGIIRHGIPNMARRIYGRMFRVLPPFMIGYAIYSWGEEANHKFSRKNPKDYENDV